MTFEPFAEIPMAVGGAAVYAEGWQSWSAAAIYAVGDYCRRTPQDLRPTMGLRPARPDPARGIEAAGILALALPGGGARAWFAPEPTRRVPSIRLDDRGDRLIVSADAPVREIGAAGLEEVLAAVGDAMSPGEVSAIGPGWCSWSAYFGQITAADVMENVAAVARLELPIEIAQVDDGYQAGIGDWLEVTPRFGSLRSLADRIIGAGMLPGVWTAPLLVGDRSSLARAHPEWLLGGVDAGCNWNQRLRVLDVTHPDAADHLRSIFHVLADWGFAYYKLDFLYAGALDGARRSDCSALVAYREGLRLVRQATGPDAILVGCGAPLLPSIGLVDAMRIGPDVLPESPYEEPDLAYVIRATRLRSWMNKRLWLNDPDCLVVRPEIAERETWASHLQRYSGLVFSSDRLRALDARGLELTRRVLDSRQARA